MKLAEIPAKVRRDPKLANAFTRRSFLKQSSVLIGAAGFGALGRASTALGQTAAQSRWH